ncbi:MAG: serine hydrolase [Balneolaceae bacterium]|nr:serine hydrolase [Balneolaceae bacterium]
MKTTCFILFLLMLLTPALLAQEISTEQIDEIFEEFDQPQTPGCAVGINQNGETIFKKGYGTANLDYGIPITPDSRFMIASISKQFAAAALLMLEQEGNLDLDEDLRSHIPEISQFDHPITARQLIHHTSGIRDIYNLLIIADIGLDNTTTSQQALELLSHQQKLNFDPGTQHLYSNMAYFLISVIVEKFSGLSLREYSHKHFFEPIGMDATHWHDDTEEIVSGRVISYLSTNDGPGMFYRGNMDRVGARGLFTTISDFAKWDLNFNENRSNLENFTSKMIQPGYTTETDSINYASGLRLGKYKSLYTLGHGGNYMGFRSHYMRFPGHDLGIFVFCNMSNINPADYTLEVADLYLKDIFDELFDEYTGTYRNNGLNSQFSVQAKEDNLYLKRAFEEPRELSWSDDDRFTAGQWNLRFLRDDEGAIKAFTIEAPRTGTLTFTRQTN